MLFWNSQTDKGIEPNQSLLVVAGNLITSVFQASVFLITSVAKKIRKQWFWQQRSLSIELVLNLKVGMQKKTAQGIDSQRNLKQHLSKFMFECQLKKVGSIYTLKTSNSFFFILCLEIQKICIGILKSTFLTFIQT